MSRTVFFSVTGRVQGVGYRAFVEAEALALGLAGYVRNRRDGSVEVLASGEVAAIEALVAACRDGPAGARVDAISTTDSADLPPIGFAILPTSKDASG